MRASAFHDAVYRLIRAGALESATKPRKTADKMFETLAAADDHFAPGAAYLTLRLFGGFGTARPPKRGELVCVGIAS